MTARSGRSDYTEPWSSVEIREDDQELEDSEQEEDHPRHHHYHQHQQHQPDDDDDDQFRIRPVEKIEKRPPHETHGQQQLQQQMKYDQEPKQSRASTETFNTVQGSSTSNQQLNGEEKATEAKGKEGKDDFSFADLIVGRVDSFLKPNLLQLRKQNHATVAEYAANKERPWTLKDIDMILVGNKLKAKSFLDKLPIRFMSCKSKKFQQLAEFYDSNAKRVRQSYFSKLEQEYSIQSKVLFENDEHIFYAVNLSFAHLGLMQQLLGYQWPLASGSAMEIEQEPASESHKTSWQSVIVPIKNSDESKDELKPSGNSNNNNLVAYKAFRFLKNAKNQQQQQQQQHSPGGGKESNILFKFQKFFNCKDRSSYPSQLRHDLAYQFLTGAYVKVLMPDYGIDAWSDFLTCDRLDDDPKLIDVNFTEVIERGIFDDWLCLHQQMPPAVKQDRRIEAEQERNKTNTCCRICLFPCMTGSSCCRSCTSQNNKKSTGLCATIW